MLEGTLESFTLPDIFQLLSLTKKTGCLRLRREAAHGRVYFKDGQVYYAVADTARLALGRRLVGAGLVSTEQLQEALSRQRELVRVGEGLRLGRILVEGGAIDDDTLETFVREQVQDAVFDLMRWADGSFAFDTEGEGAVVEEPIELSASVENLIMEGSRRLEEWQSISRKIPSTEAVVAMQPLAGDGEVDVSLKPEEWRLLTLIDGRRTVGELVDVSGQGEFHTCRVLYGMVGAGLIEIRDLEADGPPSIAALLSQQELLRELEAEESGHASAHRALDAVTGGVQGTTEPDVASDEDEETDVTDVTEEPEAAETPADDGGQDRLTTDPAIDEDLVQRLIAGVKGL